MNESTTMAGDRAGLVYRVSTGGQDEANQVPDVMDYCKRKGYRTSERSTWTLHDKSASKGDQQAAQDEVVAQVRAGLVKVVVAWYSSRLDRRELEYLLRFIRQVKEAGGRVETVHEGLLDGHNLNTIIAGYMNHEKSLTVIRETEAGIARVRANKAFAGRIPFGYESKGPKYSHQLVVVEELCPIVEEIFQRVINGESLAEVCLWLDSLRCKRSKTTGEVTPWWAPMVMKLIRHPAYSGTYRVKRTVSGKVITYNHTCEAIVTRSVQRQAIEALSAKEKRSRGRKGDPESRAMLKSAVVCGNPDCDATGPHPSPMHRITGRLGGTRVEYYRCFGRGPQRKGCGNLPIMAVIDDAVNKIIAEAFAVPITRIILVKGHDWTDEIDALVTERSQLPDDDEYDRRHAELTAQIKDYKARDAEPDREIEDVTDELWSDAYAALGRSERGAWMTAHGFTVYATKTLVRVVQGEGGRARIGEAHL